MNYAPAGRVKGVKGWGSKVITEYGVVHNMGGAELLKPCIGAKTGGREARQRGRKGCGEEEERIGQFPLTASTARARIIVNEL